MAADSEQKTSDNYGDLNRFGRHSLVDRIRHDGGKIGEVLRHNDTLESLKETKKKILAEIRNSQLPFTFVFDGHGGKDALYLSNRRTMAADETRETFETAEAREITAEELFDAYKERQGKFGIAQKTPETRDIFVDGGCYNSNFIRNFYLLCDKENIPKPIVMGESEYGQSGYSDPDSEYGNAFFDNMFDRSYTQRATLGNLMSNEQLNDYSNPSLYIPDVENRTMQISKQRRVSSTSVA